MKCYAVGENKCLVETYSKDDQDNLIITVKVPLGKINGTYATKNVLYPDGFGRDNCAVVGLAYQLNNGDYKRTDRYNINQYYYHPYCNLGGNYMEVGMVSSDGSATVSYNTFYVYVTLMKTKTIDGEVIE